MRLRTTRSKTKEKPGTNPCWGSTTLLLQLRDDLGLLVAANAITDGLVTEELFPCPPQGGSFGV